MKVIVLPCASRCKYRPWFVKLQTSRLLAVGLHEWVAASDIARER